MHTSNSLANKEISADIYLKFFLIFLVSFEWSRDWATGCMLNQNKKDRKSGYQNNRRTKPKTDNISFISGPVQYQPRPQSALNSSNFINTSLNHLHSTSASRRGNAWGATNGKLSRSQSQSISPPNLKKSNLNKSRSSPSKQKQQNSKNIEYPSLDESNPSTKSSSNNNNANSLNPTLSSSNDRQSSWLQYDKHDDEHFDNSPPQNGKNAPPPPPPQHKNAYSDSSHSQSQSQQQHVDRFPVRSQNYNQQQPYHSSPRHNRSSYHHQHHQQRAINVDVNSFERMSIWCEFA